MSKRPRETSVVQVGRSPRIRSSSRTRCRASRASTSVRPLPKTLSTSSRAESSFASEGRATGGTGGRVETRAGFSLRSKARRNRRGKAVGSSLGEARFSTHATSSVPAAVSSPFEMHGDAILAVDAPVDVERRGHRRQQAKDCRSRRNERARRVPGRSPTRTDRTERVPRRGSTDRSTATTWRSPSVAPRGTTQIARRWPSFERSPT